MKKFKILNNLNYTNDDIGKVVDDIHELGYGKLESVLPKTLCEDLADAADDIEKSKLKLIKEKSLITKTLSKSIKNGQTFIRNVILDKPELFMPLIDLKPIMLVLERIFKDIFILDGLGISKSHKITKKKFTRTPPHVDSHIVSPSKNHILDIVACICLDDFTKFNGATKVWPKSHKSGVLIHKDPKYKNKIPSGAIDLQCLKGDIFFFTGQTWHQIGENKNNKRRWGVLSHYKRWWIKPSIDYTKCGKNIFKKLNDMQKILLGFTSRTPSPQSGRLKTILDISNLSDDYDKAITS